MAKSDIVTQILAQWNKRVPFLTHKTDDGKEMLSKFLATIYSDGMSNLGQSKHELELQKLADIIYREAYGTECPYRVYLTAGYTDHLYQAIHLMDFDSACSHDVDTLCHELGHVRHPKHSHGKRFQKKVDQLIEIADRVLS